VIPVGRELASHKAVELYRRYPYHTELFDDAILGDGLVDHQCRKNIGQS
jgi:hypothetical protein